MLLIHHQPMLKQVNFHFSQIWQYLHELFHLKEYFLAPLVPHYRLQLYDLLHELQFLHLLQHLFFQLYIILYLQYILQLLLLMDDLIPFQHLLDTLILHIHYLHKFLYQLLWDFLLLMYLFCQIPWYLVC